MKNLLLLLLFLIPCFADAATYYVSPTGNDNNPGTITSPFKTLGKLNAVMVQGDIAYIRGGTYRASGNNGGGNDFALSGLIGTSSNPITIRSYPGEVPVFNFDHQVPTICYPWAITIINCPYLHLKGRMQFTSLQQIPSGCGDSRGMLLRNSNNAVIENIEICYMGGVGFTCESSNDVTYLNCDSHNNADPLNAVPFDGADGFAHSGGDGSTRLIYTNCRAWLNADDGFDTFGTDGITTFNNCLSFANGYYQPIGQATPTPAGNGQGYKLGPASGGPDGPDLNTISRFLNNCIAFNNRDNGFDANGTQTMPFQLYNCAAYGNNGNGYHFAYYNTSPGPTDLFKNCLSYANGGYKIRYCGANANNINNTWNNGSRDGNCGWTGGMVVTNEDFVTLDTSGVSGARQNDGTLPVLQFLKLKSGSALIDAGIDVGLPFNGSAPDLGAYEFSASTNIAPTANANSDQTITLPLASVTLPGSGTDPDGTINAYLWRKISGPTSGTITNTVIASTTATGLVQGIYKFELKVTDNNGATDTDTMQVTVNAAVNQPPTANAGADQNISLPTIIVSLTGSGTDPDGTIVAYQWTKISGPSSGIITTLTSAVTTVTALIQGVYKFELKVTDNNGATDTDTIQVSVNATNQAPIANAGIDQTITLPINSVSLSGNGTDPDGTITAYRWRKIAGPATFAIGSTLSAATTVTGLVEGVYQFELRVTDNQGATGWDTIQVTVNAAINQPPTANAGLDKNIILPTNSTSLNGSGIDPDGSISAYQWIKISGPANGTISNATSASTAVTGLTEGLYEFELTVTDNDGASNTDTMQVTVTPAPNQAPTADAGSNQTITLPTNSITLSGSGIDPDGTITSYVWIKLSGPASGTITNANLATTTVTGLVQGIYQFQLQVTDNDGTTDADIMQVNVNAAPPPPNLSPIANAGADRNITLPTNNVSLSGSGIDPDGTITAYLWRKISGPTGVTIATTTAAITSATGLVQGTYKFELKVTDNSGATNRDTMQVIVNAAINQAPTANAGLDKNITLPTNSTSLNGNGTDPDGTITAYLWTRISGPVNGTISNATSATTSVTGLVQGVYKFELKVTDNNGATDTDTMQVTVNAAPNQVPTAEAGINQTITLPTNSITLSGSGTDPDGTIVSYLWIKLSGPAAGTITNATSASTTVTGLVQGVYQFQLRVTDNSGATDTDVMQVNVNAANQPPVANAGLDQNITLPTNSTSLNGSGTDPDGTISTYLWTKISGPTAGTISNAASASTSVTGLVQGVYKFQLRITDNGGATDTDTMQVTVNAAINQPPTANAGLDKYITLPTNTVPLNGSGTDPDGTISSYLWTKISGPTAGTISNAASATTSANGLVQGVYKFQLRVTDNSGATDTDTMQVTVNAANQLPVANAGLDQNITLPTSSSSLNGSGTDPDGIITAYLWTKISGPTAGTISNAASATTSVTGLVQGVYKFQLKVTDNSGAIDTDTMQVTVNAAINQPPTANAGSDQNITLPTSVASLNGSGTDPDGMISTYLWTKISGPTGGTITNVSSATTSLTGLVQGVYKFQLRVTDNNGASDTDTMQVTVNAAINQPPTAIAGLDKNITLPTNNVSLNGSGTDPDGTITTYLWTKISGPTAGTISNAAAATTSVTGLVQGVYKFQLKVTDNNGATDTDTMQVAVNAAINQPPTANAGLDQNITLPTNAVSLNGSGTDPDGTITAYLWTKVSGPASGTISNASSATTTVTGMTEGIYEFQLRVTDNSGATDTDIMQVTVNAIPVPNLAPVANAGSDTSIYLPDNSVALSGTGNDPDGQVVSYNWNVISGTSFLLSNSNSATANLAALEQGIYEVELTVTDNSGAVGKDTITITVGAARLQVATDDVRIIGNPVQNILKAEISSTSVNRLMKIMLFDINGTLLYQKGIRLDQNIQLEEIDMTRFSRGTYILQVYFDKKTPVIRKAIKM